MQKILCAYGSNILMYYICMYIRTYICRSIYNNVKKSNIHNRILLYAHIMHVCTYGKKFIHMYTYIHTYLHSYQCVSRKLIYTAIIYKFLYAQLVVIAFDVFFVFLEIANLPSKFYLKN